MESRATPAEIEAVKAALAADGLTPSPSQGSEKLIIGAIGDDRKLSKGRYRALAGVERVVPILEPYRLAARSGQPQGSIVRVNESISFGGAEIPVVMGSCSVESEEQFMALAEKLAAQGCVIVRGGAFKPRSSPYSFQGLGEAGLKIMAAARAEYGTAVVTEVLGENDVDLVSAYADVLQIGARNMQNYRLLEAVGGQPKPVLLKRGMSATIEEWLLAAEYIMNAGNAQVILCERGIRSYDQSTRFACDINAVPLLKKLTHLPVVLDPSHATGVADLVAPVAMAGIAAGCDGLLVEVHERPSSAVSDAAQTLDLQQAESLRRQCEAIAGAVGRKIV